MNPPAGVSGVYLKILGRPGEPMLTQSMDKSGLRLLRGDVTRPSPGRAPEAVIFATHPGLANLRKKIGSFGSGALLDASGRARRPPNADLVQSIGEIVEAGLRALWRSPPNLFPAGDEPVQWELWLTPDEANGFIEAASRFSIDIGSERLEFPEDLVVMARATPLALAGAVRTLGAVRALAAVSVTAAFFDDMPVEEQTQWVASVSSRAVFEAQDNPGYVALLDTGVARGHPLLANALEAADRHAAKPSWDVEDRVGHGTKLAGLALYGDMTTVLQGTMPVSIGNRLESAKIIPDAGFNPHYILGSTTRAGVDVLEARNERRRTFTLATTTKDDSPHDGAPTSWSTEVDQLAAGASGLQRRPRLILVSAGNSDRNRFGNTDYHASIDHPDNEIESPAQAWNSICVGAYTDKQTLPPGEIGSALAPVGDISPSSRTASWSSQWPLKPDVVLEGGNWHVHGMPPPFLHAALQPLTTSHEFPKRSFATCGETSGATGLAARAITELWTDYPSLRPETIRALFISSARWTTQMRSHLNGGPGKGQFARLFQRYGYGVPDMARARRSAANALTLIVEDAITPYRKSASPSAEHVHNELRLFELPWPVEELRKLTSSLVTLRVALSTFVFPNPSEAARGMRYRYASHNLRFKLNRPDESQAAFLARINKLADRADEPQNDEDDGWAFGRNRRDVGSLHIDEMTIKASDLARRNLIAVHPVAGWWKSRRDLDPSRHPARFSLIVEIDAGSVDVDLYSEIQSAIANASIIQTLV
jgi:hypothetical protein